MIKESEAIAFKKGQRVVYPLQGVGIIENIEERPFKNKKTPYYIIYFSVSDMTICLPVKSAAKQGLRPIVSKTDSEKALKIIASNYEHLTTDWKLRYQMNLDLLKKGGITDIATVVTNLYHRSKIKELPILERKLYDSALNLLVDEVAYSQDKKIEDVEQIIFDKLEPSIDEEPEDAI